MMGRKSSLVIAFLRLLSLLSSTRAFTTPSTSQTHHFLNDELRAKVASMHPQMAERISDPEAFVRPTEEWFDQYLSLSSADKKKIYARWPNGAKEINRLGRRRLHEWLAFFLSEEVGLDQVQLRKLVVSRPQLLTYGLSNVKATTAYFREELGLSSTDYASMLLAYPSVLMYSVDRRLRPTVDFLQNECGGGKENWDGWNRVVHAYPRIFSHSLERTLLPKINFLCSKKGEMESLGLKRSELSQVVAKFPPTLWLSEINLQSKLDYLRESLGLKGSELRAIVVSYPQILGLSLQNLMEKVTFFLDDEHYANAASSQPEDASTSLDESLDSINCGLSKEQLKEFVLYQPALLAYSLENRLKPRVRQMQEKNIFLYYCPRNIMSYTDDKFDSWMSSQIATWSISE